MSVISLDHEGHECTEDPLTVYPRHLEDIEQFQEIKTLATSHRIAVIPYSASRRVLESHEFDIHLTSQKYYNLVRRMKPTPEDLDIIGGLLAALEDRGFVY